MRSSASRLTWAVIALAAGAGCRLAHTETWHDEGDHRWRELRVPRRGGPGFTSLRGSKTGITFVNEVTEGQLVENRHLLNGSGVALGDVDGDGWVDVYFSRLNGSNVLYKNMGGWRFEDVTELAGVAAPNRYSTGAVFADVDGDGDLDLLVSALGGPNALFINDGNGTFREQTDEAGLASTLASHTMTLADVDADGDLDLYVVNYKVKNVVDLFPPEAREFDRVVRQEGDDYVVIPEFQEHYALKRRGARLGLLEIAEPDRFYLNDGTGRFEAVSFTSGRFLDEDGNTLREPPAEWGLTARFHDVDGDGDPDLYVCNDFESVDRLWLNDGAGRFRLAPRLALRSTSHSSMAVDFSDLDRDGDMDLLLVDMLSRDSQRRRTQSQPVAPEVPQVGVFDDRQQKQRNTLFLNRGDGTYAEVAHIAGVAASGWSWGTLFMDVDLDGYEDVLISTGNLFDVLDSDTQARGARRSRAADLLRFPPLPLRNVAFRNRGGFTFEEVGERWGFGTEEDISHGIASADLDGDGDLDVVLNRLGAPAAVLRNDASAGRIAVRLRGEEPNTQGVGSKIRVLGGPVGEQIKEVTVGGMYLSGSDQLYTFATGDADELQVVVDWRSGRRSVVSGARPNRLYEIREPDVEPGEGAAGDRLSRVSPFFVDATADLGHVHVEREYNDFIRQPLLPNRLSQLGPGVTWYDLDRDGDEDLLITSGKGGRLAYYRNDGGRFTNVPIRMPEAFLDQTTVLPLRGGGVGGDVSLLVGQMNYEAVSPAAARDAAAVLRIDAGVAGYGSATVRPRTSTAVSGSVSAVGPLALADYDGDGDLDLFVGGRVLTARYPIAASSRLLFNDGGTFRVDGGNNRAFTSMGLVSAALFSDIDADGDPDLILAMEWGPIRVFENDGGRFLDVTAARGLAGYSGRWNGVATGDLNGDGLMDIVATNWGRNLGLRVDAAQPLRVYFNDFDNNGTLDVVTAQIDKRLDAMSPLASFRELASAMPFLRRRISNFAAYADASVQDVIGPALANASTLDVTTLEHMLFLNRGDRFEARALPWEAQLAPSFYVGVADFDGDGNEDVFLTQNFFATRIDAERHDAGRGLWLRGDGTGNLTAVAGQESGVTVYGEQRGAALADYNGDGRVDLAVSQNGAETILYRNERAKPGLRVRLVGPTTNPDAIGATIRLVYDGWRGPARELQAGSGYWSHNAVVHVLGLQGEPTAVWVRWPGGAETQTPIEAGTSEVTIGENGRVVGAR